MDSDEVEEDPASRFVDYTNATEWEVFVSKLEDLIRRWGLADSGTYFGRSSSSFSIHHDPNLVVHYLLALPLKKWLSFRCALYQTISEDRSCFSFILPPFRFPSPSTHYSSASINLSIKHLLIVMRVFTKLAFDLNTLKTAPFSSPTSPTWTIRPKPFFLIALN